MFSGIIQYTGSVHSVTDSPGLRRLTITCPSPLLQNLQIGASIALNGTCLTVTSFTPTTVSFDLIHETLSRTTLGILKPSSPIHLERSLKLGDEIGGHLLSGHIDTTATLLATERTPNNYALTFQIPPNFINYLFPKGFIAIDGVSLTVVNVDRINHTFSVHLIPETLRVTHLGNLNGNDQVNIEIDRQTQAIVDTIKHILSTTSATEPIQSILPMPHKAAI